MNQVTSMKKIEGMSNAFVLMLAGLVVLVGLTAGLAILDKINSPEPDPPVDAWAGRAVPVAKAVQGRVAQQIVHDRQEREQAAPKPAAAASSPNSATAVLCAGNDAGHHVDESDPEVDKYQAALDLLVTEYEGGDKSFHDAAARIANVVFHTQGRLASDGFHISQYEILSDLSQVHLMSRKLDIETFAANYAILCETGMPRAQVVATLQVGASSNADQPNESPFEKFVRENVPEEKERQQEAERRMRLSGYSGDFGADRVIHAGGQQR
jgi:hypothetical protein